MVSRVNNSCIFERRPELTAHDFAKPGAQKQFTVHPLLKHLPTDGMEGNAWYALVEENIAMSRSTYKNLRTELKERGDIELIKRDGKQIWVKTQSCLLLAAFRRVSELDGEQDWAFLSGGSLRGLEEGIPSDPRDTDVSWSLRNPEAGRLADD